LKLTPWYLIAIAPIAAASASGAVLGQLAVLVVVGAIFFGTLTLGRGPANTSAHVQSPSAALTKSV